MFEIFLFDFTGDSEEIEKCGQYWPTDPNATESFGHIQVTTLSESTEVFLENTTLRTLHLKGIYVMSMFLQIIKSAPIYLCIDRVW